MDLAIANAEAFMFLSLLLANLDKPEPKAELLELVILGDIFLLLIHLRISTEEGIRLLFIPSL